MENEDMADLKGRQGKLKKGLDVFGDLFVLNVCFVVTACLGITTGAALTALYYVTLKMVRGEEGKISESFFWAFRENFKRATVAWLLLLLVLFIFFGEYLYILNFSGAMVRFYKIFLGVELFIFALILPFLFPLIARFENTLFRTVKNSFLLAVSDLGAWIKIVVAWVAPIALSVIYPAIFAFTWYLWLLLLFALIAYGTSHTIHRVFAMVEAVQEEKSSET